VSDQEGTIPQQDGLEADYVAALSRPSVVQAYAGWEELSAAERFCFERFLRPEFSVLDLGCGAGRFLAATGSNWRAYVGIDNSEAMTGAARARFPNADFRQGDMFRLEVTRHSYDAVLMLRNVIDMLHPLERRSAALSLAREALSERGILVCSSHLARRGQPAGYVQEDYHGAIVSTYRSAISEWCAELERAGFDVVMVLRDVRETGDADWAYAVAQPNVV
jgi:SAM-dependent methyltransferase